MPQVRDYFVFDHSIDHVDDLVCHRCGRYLWDDPIEHSKWMLWILGESPEESLVLEKMPRPSQNFVEWRMEDGEIVESPAEWGIRKKQND